ncbi:MAG: shikimate dehydrogenase [Cyclobacteriaceae bacterium]|nr:shikimate dehydrogenase [Cyclobacteriaceae bacterium]
MKKSYGLIGFPLSHSFSKKYFSNKFLTENIKDCTYELYEIDEIKKVDQIFQIEGLQGLNVTIPYKHDIMAYLDGLDHSAKKVGAVNVVKISAEGHRTGFNSDYYGFRRSLETWLPEVKSYHAMVLGIGGAARAVLAVLEDLHIPTLKVSRDATKGDIDYHELLRRPELLHKHKLIINTTPLGMLPNTDAKPGIDYSQLGKEHFLYDLIYNPAETSFLAEGKKRGAHTKNGLEMLELQAEKSWEIWNS